MVATKSPRGTPRNAANRETGLPDSEKARRRKKQLTTWPIAKIRQLPGQPRIHFDPEYMAALRRSIEQVGLNVPIEIWLPADLPADRAELIDGDRRWQTLRDLGVEECDVIIRYPKDREEAIDWSEEANANRAPHSPMEEAWRYQRRIDRGQSREEIGAVFGVSEGTVDNYAILTHLHPSLQELISKYSRDREALPLSRARRIARYDHEKQLKIWERAQSMTAAKFDAYMAALDSDGDGLAEGRSSRPKHPQELRRVWASRVRKAIDQLETLESLNLAPMFPVATRERDVAEFDQVLAALERRVRACRLKLAAQKKGAK